MQKCCDISTTMYKVFANFEKAKEKAEYIKKTQFRSFEFMPRVAYWKYQDLDIPEQEIKLDDIQELQNQIFWIVPLHIHIVATIF